MADASDRERGCLLADLHDGLGQELAALSLLLRANIKNPPPTRALLVRELRYLSDLVQQAIRTLRRLTGGSLGFEQSSLVEALRQLARTLSRIPGLSVRFSSRGARTHAFSGPAASQLYAIAQEAVANALKHSHARQITIELVASKLRVRLSIIDDGRGIGRPRVSGCGLQSMRLRAATIGGALDIEPGKQGGTVVTCAYPNPGWAARDLREPAV